VIKKRDVKDVAVHATKDYAVRAFLHSFLTPAVGRLTVSVTLTINTV
jgi:hypothetical protein